MCQTRTQVKTLPSIHSPSHNLPVARTQLDKKEVGIRDTEASDLSFASMPERPTGEDMTCPAASKPAVSLTWAPVEQGGVEMLTMRTLLQTDAQAQEGLVERLGRVLDYTILNSADLKQPGPESALKSFDSDKPCPLSPSAYLSRILRYTKSSPCNMMIGVMYMQRIRDMQDPSAGPLRLGKRNYQRLLLCATMIASKLFDDYYASNKQWALVGDIRTAELNQLELELLKALDYDLFISREDYNLSCNLLDDLHCAINSSGSRSQTAKTAPSHRPGSSPQTAQAAPLHGCAQGADLHSHCDDQKVTATRNKRNGQSCPPVPVNEPDRTCRHDSASSKEVAKPFAGGKVLGHGHGSTALPCGPVAPSLSSSLGSSRSSTSGPSTPPQADSASLQKSCDACDSISSRVHSLSVRETKEWEEFVRGGYEVVR
jgi:hypothetical protein